MRGHFKLAVLTALLFASAGVFVVASSANADGVIEAPALLVVLSRLTPETS